jgi:hypothetical protein
MGEHVGVEAIRIETDRSAGELAAKARPIVTEVPVAGVRGHASVLQRARHEKAHELEPGADVVRLESGVGSRRRQRHGFGLLSACGCSRERYRQGYRVSRRSKCAAAQLVHENLLLWAR